MLVAEACGDGDLVTALGATTVEYGGTGLGLHAGKKAVGLGAVTTIGLESTLRHGAVLLIPETELGGTKLGDMAGIHGPVGTRVEALVQLREVPWRQLLSIRDRRGKREGNYARDASKGRRNMSGRDLRRGGAAEDDTPWKRVNGR